MEFLGVLQAVLLGIIEGITEWLPVSSTGHMVLFNHFYPNKFSSQFCDMFEYVIQLAAIFAVVILFWSSIFPWKKTETAQGKPAVAWNKEVLSLWGKVLIACIPAILALVPDMLFEELCESHPLIEPLTIACTLILYGAVFLIVENRNKNKSAAISEVCALSYKYAFFIGCFQLLAAIPGTSRSGITIIGALLLGVDRTTASKFTFILAIPTMVGASGYKLLKFFMEAGTMTAPELGYLLIGSVVAFAVSLVAIKSLMNFVRKHNFKPFGWYRIALGAIVLGALVVPTFF
jgi:undecaprenyl-diphosphatase